MKKLLIILTLMTVSFSAESNGDLCKAVSGAAGRIMRHRQYNGDITVVMEELSGGDKNTQTLLKNIIIMAWEEPRYHTEEAKERAITEFKSKNYLGCIKAMEGVE